MSSHQLGPQLDPCLLSSHLGEAQGKRGRLGSQWEGLGVGTQA